MVSNESLVYTMLVGRKKRQRDHVRSISSPESFLLNVSTQKHMPHKEGIGNDGVMIGDSYTEVGLVGP